MKKYKKSIRVVWLFRYVIIMALPLMACLLIYNSSITIVKKQFEVSKNALSKNIIFSINEIFSDYALMKNNISQNNRFNNIIRKEHEKFLVNDADSIEIKKIIENVNNKSEYDRQIFMYFDKSKQLLSSNKIYSIDTIDNVFGESINSVRSELLYGDTTSYYHFTDSSSDQILLSIIPLINDNFGRSSVKLIVKERISTLIKDINKEKKELLMEYFILDNNSNVVLASHNFNNINVSSVYSEYYRTGFYKFNGEKYDVITNNSDTSHLQYLVAFSNANAIKQLKHFQYITLAFIIFILILGVLLMVYFIRKNYKSVSSILSTINSNHNKKSFSNEFYEIKYAIDTLIKKEEASSSQLSETIVNLNMEQMLSLITGHLPEVKAINLLNSILPCKCKHMNFRVLVVHIITIEQLFSNVRISDLERYKEAKFIINNIFYELLYPLATPFIDINHDFICILNTQMLEKRLMDKIEYGHQFILQHFGLMIKISISDSDKDVKKIPSSFHQALFRLESGSSVTMPIVTQTSVKKNLASQFAYSLEAEYKLLHLLRHKNVDGCAKLINEILIKNENSTFVLCSDKCLINSITCSVLRFASELNDNDAMKTVWEQIDEIFETKNIQVAKSYLFNLCELVCKLNQEYSENDIVARVIKIVEEEYKNIDLSVSYIADKLGLHNVYLSSIFKEKTDGGLLDYINRFRIEKAKEIISTNKNITIETVASNVGYNNSKTLSRNFKKYENTTPSNFRGL